MRFNKNQLKEYREYVERFVTDNYGFHIIAPKELSNDVEELKIGSRIFYASEESKCIKIVDNNVVLYKEYNYKLAKDYEVYETTQSYIKNCIDLLKAYLDESYEGENYELVRYDYSDLRINFSHRFLDLVIDIFDIEYGIKDILKTINSEVKRIKLEKKVTGFNDLMPKITGLINNWCKSNYLEMVEQDNRVFIRDNENYYGICVLSWK